MKAYHHFVVEDFVWDEAFRKWVLKPDREDDVFWQQWLAENPDKADTICQARDIVKSIGPTIVQLSDHERENAVSLIMEHFDQQIKEQTALDTPSIFWSATWFKAACVLVLLTGFIFLFGRYSDQKRISYEHLVEASGDEMKEVINTSGAEMWVTLEDSSRISLDPGSRISFPVRFKISKREIYLSGGAFFEVQKQPNRPFYVYSDEVVTKVLGTSFRIRSFDHEKEVSVSVKTGKVAVFTRDAIRPDQVSTVNERSGVVIEPNQQITVLRKTIKMTKTLVPNPEPVIAANAIPEFQFDDSPVSEIFKTLQNAYGIEIIFDENTMKDCPVTATLTDLSLYEKLDLVCNAVGAGYEVIDGKIVVDGKGCREM